MGKIIYEPLNDGMYQFPLPTPPRDEREILFFDRPRKEQFWVTPAIKDVKRMSVSERIKYIELERQRWSEGCFAFINGELKYINGLHYDHLVYMTFKGKKAEYFEHQRPDFLFRELTFKDPKCEGRVFMKPRRYGMTMEEQTEATYRLNEAEGNFVGLQSDTPAKVKTTLLTPIINSYVKRPWWMRSDYYKPNGKLLVSRLSLESNMAPGDDENGKDNFLEGWINGFPTLPRSMDGDEMAYIVMDEVWKWQTSSPKEVLESNIKVLHGRKHHGKISVLSTMGDSDDYIRAVMDGCDIIAQSNPSIRNDNGFTLSGLYEYFVPAIYSFDIPPDIFEVDKYGVVNKEKHLEYIQNKFKKLDKNSKSYIFEKRRLPLTKNDALMSSQIVTYFSKPRITERLNHLRGLTYDKKPYVRGNLVETNSGRVYFKEDQETGIWLISNHPYFSVEKNIDLRNRFFISDGVKFPPRNAEGCIGYDPIRYRKEDTTSNNLSRASAIVHKKFDYYGTGVIDVKCGLMLYRPDDPKDAHREVIKACKYWGFPCMHERQVETVKEVFEEQNMIPFLMPNEKDGICGIWTDSTGKIAKNGIEMLVTRYSAPKVPEDIDHLAIYPFEDGLKDLDMFDMASTTAFDVTMSEIFLEYGLKQIKFTNVDDRQTSQMSDRAHEVMAPRNHLASR